MTRINKAVQRHAPTTPISCTSKEVSMIRKLILSLALVALAALAFALPALAGGWAVVTLDELPASVVAGQPLSVSFMVRQHGVRPMEGLSPIIRVRRVGAMESINVTAEPLGEVGRYAATLTLPSAGTWEWTIDAFGFPQVMPALAVSANASAPVSAPATAATAWPMMIGVASLVVAAAALIILARTRRPWAAALVLAAAVIGLAGFASAGQPPAQAAASVPRSPVEQGEALFVAKGCVVCHAHAAMRDVRQQMGIEHFNASSSEFSTGPDLSQRAVTEQFLQIWLKDPQAVRPDTNMPNLGLKKVEIDALAAFLTANQGQ
jgi:cytochrome c2